MVIDQNRVNLLKDRQNLQFEEALYLLHAGQKVCRAAWKDLRYVAMQKPDDNSKMKRPYLFAVPTDNQAVPYALTNSDLFMIDWQVYKA